MARPHVVLVHGLWYGPTAMWPLARVLQRQGHTVSRFGYASVTGNWAENVAALQQHLAGALAESLHIVGHSLGGLLALAALSAQPCERAAAVANVHQLIMLGTPLQGSASARKLLQSALTAKLLGYSGSVLAQGLTAQVPIVASRARLVMIAGNKPLGLGKLLADLDGAHDGTVAVSETAHPALHAHVVVPCGHSGLLLFRQVQDVLLQQLAGSRDVI